MGLGAYWRGEIEYHRDIHVVVKVGNFADTFVGCAIATYLDEKTIEGLDDQWNTPATAAR